MSPNLSLLSILSLEECISRLEDVGKQEKVDLFGEYHPVRCEVRRFTSTDFVKPFTSIILRKRKGIYAMWVDVKLHQVEGVYKTWINCSVIDPSIPGDLEDETNDRLEKVNRNAGIFLLLALTPVAVFFLVTKNITVSIVVGLLLAITSFSLLRPYYAKNQGKKDVDAIVSFLKKTLKAR
jgi:hypothetical protein